MKQFLYKTQWIYRSRQHFHMLGLNDLENYELPSVKHSYINMRIRQSSKMSLNIWIMECEIGKDFKN